jgi:ribose transport system substrate-binding protein
MKKLRVLVSLNTDKIAYQRQQAVAAEEAGRRLNVDVEVIHAENDAIQQSQQLLRIIRSPNEKPDGIIMLPVGTGLEHVGTVAARADMGWIVLNRNVDYLEQLRRIHRLPIFQVLVDQEEVGRIQGRQMEALLPRGGVALYILGPDGNPVVDQRLAGLQETKPANIQIEVVHTRTLGGAWTEQSGYESVTTWLRSSRLDLNDLSLIAGQNDNIAMGARRALEKSASGSDLERWRTLPFIGVDAVGPAKEWLRSGLLTASVALPTTADVAIELFVRAMQSDTQPQEINLAGVPQSCPPIEKLGRGKKAERRLTQGVENTGALSLVCR